MTANRKGIDWLRRHVKSRGYRVHEIHFKGDYNPIHIGNSSHYTTTADEVCVINVFC